MVVLTHPGRATAMAAVAAAIVGGVVGVLAVLVAVRAGPVAALAVPVAAVALAVVWRRPAALVGVLVAVFPLSGVDAGGIGLVPVAGAAVVAGAVVLRLVRGERIAMPPMTGWLASMWAFAAVASVLGVAPGASMTPLVTLALAIGVALVVPDLVRDDGDRRLVVGLFLLVAAVMCATSLTGFGDARAAFGGTLVEGRSQGSFAQPNELGTFAALTALMALGCASVRGVRHRWVLLAVAGVAVAALAASLSRGAWIGAVVGLGALLVLRRSSRWQLAGGLAALGVLAGVVVFLAPATPQLDVVRSRVSSFADPTGNPYDERPAIYREAVRQVRASPLLGHGLESYSSVATRQLESGGSVAPEHAHNTLLAVATETGLPAAAFLVVFTVVVASRTRRAARAFEVDEVATAPRLATLVGSGAALAVLTGQGLVDFSLRNPTLLFLTFLLLGLLLSAMRSR